MGHLFNEQCDPACHSGHQQQPDAGCCDEHRIRDEEACLYDIDFEGRYLHALSFGARNNSHHRVCPWRDPETTEVGSGLPKDEARVRSLRPQPAQVRNMGLPPTPRTFG